MNNKYMTTVKDLKNFLEDIPDDLDIVLIYNNFDIMDVKGLNLKCIDFEKKIQEGCHIKTHDINDADTMCINIGVY